MSCGKELQLFLESIKQKVMGFWAGEECLIIYGAGLEGGEHGTLSKSECDSFSPGSGGAERACAPAASGHRTLGPLVYLR